MDAVWTTEALGSLEDGGDVVQQTTGHIFTRPIAWTPSRKGICLLELFGGISTGLAAVLQAGIKVHTYLYVDNDPVAKRVATEHIRKLRKRYPHLLPREATKTTFTALALDIALVSDAQLQSHGPVDLVIAGWPCPGYIYIQTCHNYCVDGKS